MDPWLFPNEIRHYLGQTFNARSSGIVELRNHSIGGRSPKSIFTLWQLWINICIFFQKFFWLFEQCPVQPLWVLGMRCLHLPVRALSKVLLLPVWVWLVLPSTAYSKGMLPLDLWCQASLQRLPERQHLGKTVHCSGWSDRIVSWVLGPWRRGWEICTEWGLVAQRLTTDSCPVVTGHIDPQRSPCWLPTTVVSAWSGRRGGVSICLTSIQTPVGELVLAGQRYFEDGFCGWNTCYRCIMNMMFLFRIKTRGVIFFHWFLHGHYL